MFERDLKSRLPYYFFTLHENYFSSQDKRDDLLSNLSVPQTNSELIAMLLMCNVWEYDNALHNKEREKLFLKLFQHHPQFIKMPEADKRYLLAAVRRKNDLCVNKIYTNVFFHQLFSNKILFTQLQVFYTAHNTCNLSIINQDINSPEKVLVEKNKDLAQFSTKILYVISELTTNTPDDIKIISLLPSLKLRAIDYKILFLALTYLRENKIEFNNPQYCLQTDQVLNTFEAEFYRQMHIQKLITIRTNYQKYLALTMSNILTIFAFMITNIHIANDYINKYTAIFSLFVLTIASLSYNTLYMIFAIMLTLFSPNNATIILSATSSIPLMLLARNYLIQAKHHILQLCSYNLNYEATDADSSLGEEKEDRVKNIIIILYKLLKITFTKPSKDDLLLNNVVRHVLEKKIYSLTGQSTTTILAQQKKYSFTKAIVNYFHDKQNTSLKNFKYDPTAAWSTQTEMEHQANIPQPH